VNVDQVQIGGFYVRGELPTIGSPEQLWAWAGAGNDRCVVEEILPEDRLVIRVEQINWQLIVTRELFAREWRPLPNDGSSE
jgi:hypothetical protein